MSKDNDSNIRYSSSGLTHDVTSDIKAIQRILRESYPSGFTIFKELLQNAEDAGAKQMAIAAHQGFPDAQNPLLKAAGLIIANDGIVRKQHMQAITRALGGSKSSETSSVGRFGLGQKSLYHLCDAFIALGKLEDDHHGWELLVMNPWDGMEAAKKANQNWGVLTNAEEEWLIDQAEKFTKKKGMVLFLPLRTENLLPGEALCLSQQKWEPDQAINDILLDKELFATLCCLRSLETIDIIPIKAAAEQFTCGEDNNRLFGPDKQMGREEIEGSVKFSGVQLDFFGRQKWAMNGEAITLKHEENWPVDYDIKGGSIKAKANPHGSVIIGKSPDPDGEGHLRLYDAVYLPLGKSAAEIPLKNIHDNINILIHGYFFITSDRKDLSNDGIEGQWNTALRREACLPLFLDAFLDFLLSLSTIQSQYTVISALLHSNWWHENRADTASGNGLAYGWTGHSKAAWQKHALENLRPLSKDISLKDLEAVFPDIGQWCQQKNIILAFGPILSDAKPLWRDEELAELIKMAGATAFQKSQYARILADILGDNIGAHSQAILADIYRQAVMDTAHNFANEDAIKPLISHLPQDNILTLPASIEKRDFIAALCAVEKILPVKKTWLEVQTLRKYGTTETIKILSVVAPFLDGKASVAGQASALISDLLQNGPPLSELSQNSRSANLHIIPAKHLQSGSDARLSLAQLAKLMDKGCIFDAARNEELYILAEAIEKPDIYQIKQGGSLDNLASAKKTNHLIRVVKQATIFADPAKCGELADKIAKDADKATLRRLIAANPDLQDTAKLYTLTEFEGALDQLATALVRGKKSHIISSETSGQLRQNLHKKADIQRLDIQRLGEWLKKAVAANSLPEIDDAAAIALLKSKMDDAILKILPLHQCKGESQLLPANALYIGKHTQIPSDLAAHAKLAELWPDIEASAKQNRLIEKWNAAAAIKTALAADEPAHYMDIIGNALFEITALSDDIKAALQSTAWIKAKGKVWKTNQILDLPLAAGKFLSSLYAEQDEILLASALPNALRDEKIRQNLNAILPGKIASYKSAFILAGEAGCERLYDPIAQNFGDLSRLASANIDLALPVWVLIAHAITDGLAEDVIKNCNQSLAQPNDQQIIAQFNALAEYVNAENGQASEAARRLHLAAYKDSQALLLGDNGFLPENLLILNAESRFIPASQLALHAEGIAQKALIHHDYKSIFGDRKDHQPLDKPPQNNAPSDFLDDIKRAFDPIAKFDVNDGILLCLAMLGRGEDIKSLAAKYQGQRTFAQICVDLKNMTVEQLKIEITPVEKRLQELSFDSEFPQDAKISAVSAAGNICIVPLSGSGDALLLECDYRGRTNENGVYQYFWKLTFAHVDPKNEDDAIKLLEQFIRKLAPAVTLAMPSQKDALASLLRSYFDSDQRTFKETQDELKSVLHDRLRGLKPGPTIRDAIVKYDEEKLSNKEKATDNLWKAALSDNGSQELLTATREKIGEMGYQPDRTLFELYQNAVDAQAQWSGDGRICIKVQRDDDGAITLLRFIHWGRPINQPGGDAETARREGHGRDLSNMLAINHSSKDGDAIIGRFGLGFKTVHMLSDTVKLASGKITIAIKGGMIPHDWEDGATIVAQYNDKGRKATLIDIPVMADIQESAEKSVQAFTKAAPYLAILGEENSTITIKDNGEEQRFSHDAKRIIDGVRYISCGNGKFHLVFNLSADFQLLIGFGQNGAFAYTDNIPQYWHLVPLTGQARKAGWILEGRLPVDPGRTQFSGKEEEKKALFNRLGNALGDRLVEFYDYCQEHWGIFATDTGLAPDGMADFWQTIIAIFEKDVNRFQTERHLHYNNRGLAKLLGDRPLVPLITGETICATNAQWALCGVLANGDLRSSVEMLLTLISDGHAIISGEKATLLEAMGFEHIPTISLATLLDDIIGYDKQIDAQQAQSLAIIISDDFRDAMKGEENDELREKLRKDYLWQAEDGNWQPIKQLAFPQSDDKRETLRAQFAPLCARLSNDYQNDAFKLAKFAREQAGHNREIYRDWAKSAKNDQERQKAFIRYLVDENSENAQYLVKDLDWFPEIEELHKSELTAGLTEVQKRRLLANLESDHGSDNSPSDNNPPDSHNAPDTEQILWNIAQWWEENRDDIIAEYERSTYPAEFPFDALSEDDDQTWFTFLALASFQTLGRITPEQSRGFVQQAVEQGWWHELATIDQDGDDLTPYTERLRAWSEPDALDNFIIWRRFLGDLCIIARHLDDYRRLFLQLPAIIQQEGEISLYNHLRPSFSHIAARMGVDAAPLARSLGMGSNWIIRELSRMHIYSAAQADLVRPYGWTAKQRVRQLCTNIDLGHFEHGIDHGRLIYQAVHDIIDDEASFQGDGDLPFQTITLSQYRDDLREIMDAHIDRNFTNRDWSFIDE